MQPPATTPAPSPALHLRPLPSDVPAVDLAQQQTVYVILRRVVSRWTTSAKVVAVHQDEACARADLLAWRTYEPNCTFGIFVPLPEEPGGNA